MNDEFKEAEALNVFFPERDDIVLFHGPLYKLKKKFYETGKAAGESGGACVSGIDVTYSGVFGKHRASWEMKCEKSYLQQLFHEKGGYCIISKDYCGNIKSKASYRKDGSWFKSVYFETGNTSRPQYSFEYGENGAVRMLKLSGVSGMYSQTLLFPSPYNMGTKENSILSSLCGNPVFYISYSGGDLCFMPEEAAKKRNLIISQIKSGEYKTEPENISASLISNDWNSTADSEKNGSVSYIGERDKDGKEFGYGRTEDENKKTIYDGEFAEGKRNGKGALYYTDGILSYYGAWKNDKKNGLGVSVKRGFEGIHVGTWANGELSGESYIFDEKGLLKSFGMAEDGKIRGLKVLHTPAGIFIGTEKDGVYCGSLFNKDGTLLYSGSYKDGKFLGKGVSFNKDGGADTYGIWHDGKCTQRFYSQK